MPNPINTREVSLLEHQKLILKFATDVNSPYRHFIYSAGLGTGKTRLLCLFTYLQCLKHQGGTHIVIAPDYPYLKTELLPRFREILKELSVIEGVHYKVNITDLSITFLFGATIILKTARANENAFRGYNISSLAIDEIGDIPDEVVQEAFNRLRGVGHGPMCSLRVGVPQFHTTSNHWQTCTDPTLIPLGQYEVEGVPFTRCKVNPNKSLMIMFGSSHENIDILGWDYIDNLAHRFGHSKQIYKNQVHGMFESTSVKAIFNFDPKRNIVYDLDMDPYVKEIIVSIDFNIGNCTALVGYEKAGKILISNVCKAKDTEAICLEIMKIIPADKYGWTRLIITGDSAGYHRSTAGGVGKCDWDIVQEVFGVNYFNYEIIAPKFNPSVSASIVNVNRHLAPNVLTGAPETLFVSHEATALIEALQFCESDGRGRILKRGSSDKYSHPADALRYFVEFISPSSAREFGSF